MPMNNGVQLITYVDRFGGQTLSELQTLLRNELSDVFTGVHLLPFFYPIDGEDAGFDPIDHTQVDRRLGNWDGVKDLGANLDIMADMVVNHMSAESAAFQDVLANGRASQYWSLFLTKNDVFNHDCEDDIQKVFRPRPTSFFSDYALQDGDVVPFWTTFTRNQIDIDVESDLGETYLNDILDVFANNNVNLIRLDAAGYAIKRAGTNCFMLDETFAFIEKLSQRAKSSGMHCLVEIHSHYQTQIDIAERCDSVYDFALPPLVLHTLFTSDASALAHWLSISPRNCFTVLDTHDGIGIVDVGASGDKPGLLDNMQIDSLVETIHTNSQGQSRLATGAAASNVDLYQINCTYYDALGKDDLAYLTARAIQFFSPGIPQVYYGGLVAAENDMDLLAKTNVGRDINRPYLSRSDIIEKLRTPVVNALIKLCKLRNTATAFNGEFTVTYTQSVLSLNWRYQADSAVLLVNLETMDSSIQIEQSGQVSEVKLKDWLNLAEI